MPHLLLWGPGDKAFVPEIRQGVAPFCDAGFTLIDVEGTDHWLHHQKPGEVARHIAAFLDG